MTAQRKNELKYYLSNTLYNTAFLVASGSILQTFMLEIGIAEDRVAQSVSVFQVVQSVAMILFAGLADRVNKVIRVTALGMLNILIMLIPMLGFTLGNRVPKTAYIVLLAAGCLNGLVLGFYNVICYKLPYHIIDMRRYGSLSANVGIMYGLTGIAMSAVMTWLVGKYDYFLVIGIVIALAILMTVASSLIGVRFESLSFLKEEKKEKKKINIFRYKPFLQLIVPNFTRGIGTGIIGVTVTIGYYFEVIDKVSGGYVVMISNAAVIVGCLIFSKFGKAGRSGVMTFVSSVVIALSMAGMLVGRSTAVFLVCYAVGYLAVNVLSVAVPVLVTELIDYEVIGQYTAWRMMLLTVGSAIGGFLAIPMSEKLGGVATLTIAGLMFLVTGIGYYGYERKYMKHHEKDRV